MKFSIDGKVYDPAALDDVTLHDILLLEQQTRDFGRELSWDEVSGWSEEIAALKTDEEKANHPKAIWLMAVTIWASRRLAGEPVTFDEAVNFPMSSLRHIADPQDRKKPANPTKPRRSRPQGSARATSHGAAKGAAPASGTSASPSTDA